MKLKKWLSVLLAVVMVVSLMPAAFAASTTVTTEAGLKTALEDGGEVKLGDDIEVTDTIKVLDGKTVVLDLNGHTISQSKSQTAGYQMILNDGNLTITDSSTGKTGKISYTDSGNGGEYISDTIYNRGVLVINGGTIENLSSATVASNGYPHAVDTYSGIRDTSVTINGGTIYCAEYSAIRMFCVSATYKADLVINDGAIIKGAVDMQNGTAAAALGTLTIYGGTFETTKNANNIRFANWNGNATTYGITASIEGGSFNGGISTNYVPAGSTFDSKFVSGGTFGTDVSAYVAEGYKVIKNPDGTYGAFDENYTPAPAGPALYNITKAACENGKVTAQAVMASAGSTIKVAAVPAEGYKVVSLTVTDASGSEIEVVDGKVKMPASNITVSAVFMPAYLDIDPDNEHLAAICYMYENGLMVGTSTGELVFDGEVKMTRSQIAMILYNLAGEPETAYTGVFTDAPEGAWYTEAVEWAASKGIMVGVGDGAFAHNRQITVVEMAALIYRYAQCQMNGQCEAADWATESAAAMTWCVENGILAEGTVSTDIADRYLAADVFYSVYNLLNK